MSKCIPFKIDDSYGFMCMVETDFKCPKCGYLHHEKDYYPKMQKKGDDLVYIKCKGCKTKLGVAPDFKGDIHVWIKDEENDSYKYCIDTQQP